MAFDPELGDWQESSEPEQYEQPREYAGRTFDPEVEQALNSWFEGQIGSYRPLQEMRDAQVKADITRSIESFESRNDLTKSEMNEVLQTAMGFGEGVVNSTPVDQLLDYAHQVWASNPAPQRKQDVITQATPSPSKNRFQAKIDSFAAADNAFEQMLDPEVEARRRSGEESDFRQKQARGQETEFDKADRRLAKFLERYPGIR